MELGGNKELWVTGQSRRTWSVATVCRRLPVLTEFQGGFGPKRAVLGHKMRSFGSPERKGLNLIKTGSKWAQNTCLCTLGPQWSKITFGKRGFDPFFTHFCSQNGPFSRNFGISMGQNSSKWAQNGLKTLVPASHMVEDHFWKNAFFTHF